MVQANETKRKGKNKFKKQIRKEIYLLFKQNIRHTLDRRISL